MSKLADVISMPGASLCMPMNYEMREPDALLGFGMHGTSDVVVILYSWEMPGEPWQMEMGRAFQAIVVLPHVASVSSVRLSPPFPSFRLCSTHPIQEILHLKLLLLETMDFWLKGMNEDTSECSLNESDIQRCPFLKNINKPTNFSFSPLNFPVPVQGAKGPIFEDGPNFDMAFKLFHGKDGIVPLSGRSDVHCDRVKQEPTAQFNPLAARAATISLSAFTGGPFGFGPFWDKWKNQKKRSDSSNKKEPCQKGNSSNHEAFGNEWLQSGNCPIAKSYRAMSHVLPLVATAFQPPPGMKLKCPPAVVAARAALARTALVKNLRPQPLPAKMFVIALLGMAANVPLGVWREHTKKFSVSWFVAVHAAVPFIAMLRKSVLMPKTAMALTIGASILGQVIGSRAERHRLKVVAETAISAAMAESEDLSQAVSHCGREVTIWGPNRVKAGRPSSSSNNVCY
ncbi:hypothetical protein V6N11_050866 [Hibiscus sabdariffa]|uniref:Uncharacterized protein n=2 Tax=Hibiscus sabdariffa TaxID=183260 RepID=A0ABR2TB54_9ROSI